MEGTRLSSAPLKNLPYRIKGGRSGTISDAKEAADGVISLYEKWDKKPFVRFHKDSLWWKAGEGIKIYLRSTEFTSEVELYIHGAKP